MNKRGNTTAIILIGIIVAIILIGLIVILILGARPALIIGGNTRNPLPLSTFSGQWNGYDYSGESIYVGTLSGDTTMRIDPNVPCENSFTCYYINFCGNEGMSLWNKYSDIGSFYLMSGLRATDDGQNCGGNYIKATISLPAGTLKGRCVFNGYSDRKSGPHSASCFVGDFSFGGRVDANQVPVTKTTFKDFEIVLNESTELELKATTKVSKNGKVEIEIFLTSFEELTIEDPNEKLCIDTGGEWITQSPGTCECPEGFEFDKGCIIIEKDCTIDSDCPQNTCFGFSCLDGKCMMPIIGMTASPCEGAVWQDYPDCEWDESNCEKLNFFEKVLKVFYKIGQWFKGIFK